MFDIDESCNITSLREEYDDLTNNIYSIFTKIPLTKKELQTLWGITKKLNK